MLKQYFELAAGVFVNLRFLLIPIAVGTLILSVIAGVFISNNTSLLILKSGFLLDITVYLTVLVFTFNEAKIQH